MKVRPVFYELSKDEKGLVAHCKQRSGKDFDYHIHSDELSDLEKWIHSILLQIPSQNPEAKDLCLNCIRE